ncbi:MAG: hypothetical protein AAGA77_03550 [Bacteroidota bacterium]
MRNIIILLIFGVVLTSCGSTTEMESKKPVLDESIPKRESSNQPKKKASIDAEQIAAQLGLSEDKTDEFVNMWNTTEAKFRQARIDHRNGDKQLLIAKMKEVKNERDSALQEILTDTQLSRFYEIMVENRPKMPPGMKRKMGN